MFPYRKILAVDDDTSALAIYRAYFQDLEIESYFEATSGVEALQLINKHASSIDLVQIDIYMPEMDGIELLQQLHAMEYSGAIVIASGARPFDRSSAINLASTYQFNLLGLIEKPLSRQKLDTLYQPDLKQFLEAPFVPQTPRASG